MANNNKEILKNLLYIVDQLKLKDKEFLLDKLQSEQIPLSIFTTKLSSLEAICLYLRDTQGKGVKEISVLLNRNPSTIYTSYQRAKIKNVKLKIKGGVRIPILVFSDRNFSVLESLVAYLKIKKGFTLVKISQMLHKSNSTVKTVYWRRGKKL